MWVLEHFKLHMCLALFCYWRASSKCYCCCLSYVVSVTQAWECLTGEENQNFLPCEKCPTCVVLTALFYFNKVNPGVLRQASEPPLSPVIRHEWWAAGSAVYSLSAHSCNHSPRIFDRTAPSCRGAQRIRAVGAGALNSRRVILVLFGLRQITLPMWAMVLSSKLQVEFCHLSSFSLHCPWVLLQGLIWKHIFAYYCYNFASTSS